MTDKEIIIDDVDVSRCENLMQGIVPFGCMEDRKTCSCMNNPNCYYKQLKRKEQECNKLYIQLKADEEYHKEEENALRKIIKNKEERSIELYKENNKLKQTLIGIKEIAEENIRIADLEGLNGVYRRGLAEKILQKISEVENEN